MKSDIAWMIVLGLLLALLFLFSASTLFASSDYVYVQEYGDTTYYTDQDGRSAVAQRSGDTVTLYDNGSGLVDSGMVRL